MPSASASELIARKYEADGDGVVHTYQALRFDKHIRLMQSFMDLKPGARILDVGCGTGALMVELTKAGADVTGIDTFEEAGGIDRAIAEARCRESGVHVEIVEGTASALPFETGRFDIAVSIGMLEHIPPVARAGMLSEMYRVLRPGGRMMLIAGPTCATPFDQHIPVFPLSNWLPREAKRRISEWAGRRQFLAIPWGVSRRELRAALPHAAFTSLYSEYFSLDGGQPLGPFSLSPLWFLAFLKKRLHLHSLFGRVAWLLHAVGQEHCHILSIQKPGSQPSVVQQQTKA